MDAKTFMGLFANIDCEVIADYSGRGMFGSRCVAVTCSRPERLIAEVFLDLAENETSYDVMIQAAKILKDGRIDSMGRESVVYWPSMKTS